MEAGASSADESELIARQIGRRPRQPWRVAVRCQWQRPSVIASPSRLSDGTPFPTLYWLTCPYLIERAGALESEGVLAEWTERAATDVALGEAIDEAGRVLRERRAKESDGEDACAAVGIAGQREAVGLKCLHAHVALVLAGIADPAGQETLALVGEACADDECARLLDRVSASVTSGACIGPRRTR